MKLLDAKIVFDSSSTDGEVIIPFYVLGEEIVDTVTAQYQPLVANTIGKQVLEKLAIGTSWSEMAVRYQGIEPKSITIPMIWRVTRTGTSIDDVKRYARQLQSLCFPESSLGGNPPMAILSIPNLYHLNVLITSVSLQWANIWRLAERFPMYVRATVGMQQFAYLTHGRVLQGDGFDSFTKPYAGIPEG